MMAESFPLAVVAAWRGHVFCHLAPPAEPGARLFDAPSRVVTPGPVPPIDAGRCVGQSSPGLRPQWPELKTSGPPERRRRRRAIGAPGMGAEQEVNLEREGKSSWGPNGGNPTPK